MKFLKSWTIDLDKIPAYASFKTDFIIDIDYQLLELIMKSENPVFTEERKKLLVPLLGAIDKKTNTLKVKHNNRFNLGRFYPNNSISPICVSRHIKHTLFHYLDWVDLDMVKGHPSILFNIAKNNGISLPSFERYLKEPKEVLNEMIEYYSVEDAPLSTDDVKSIFNIKIYGGSNKTWVEQMGKEGKEISTNIINPFEKEFEKECRILMDIIFLNNPNITERIKGDTTNEYKLKTKVMSYFCGTIENEIIFICYKFLLKNGVIQDRKNIAPEYDGLCFKKPNLTDEKMEELINELNYKIKTDTKLEVKMILKSYNSNNIHTDIIEQRNILLLPLATEVFECLETLNNTEIETKDKSISKMSIEFYYNWKTEFEKSHFKVINKAFFIKCLKDEMGFIEEFKIFTKSEIIISYEHIEFLDNSTSFPSMKTCISKWLGDDTMRIYEDMKIIPPPLKCPKNIFNLWTPFYIEKLNEIYVWDLKYTLANEKEDLIKKCEAIINHLKILCNHNEADFLYLQRWIGQMLKYPAFKTTCITLISQEGAGKGTLLHFFKCLMGKQKVMETAEPEVYVWGKFNGMMKDCFLVNCNELEMKAQQEAESKIKALITDTELRINEKNIKAFKIDGFHRYIFTTNKDVPVKTHSKDRRHKIIRSSDEKISDKSYFDTLRKYMEDEKVLLMLYSYFIELPDLATFHLESIVQNAYQKTLAESFDRTIPELFLEDLVLQNYNETTIEKYGDELLALFVSFKHKNSFKYECDSIKLGRNIKLLKVPQDAFITKRTNKGILTLYNIPILIKYFKLENIEMIEETEETEE